MADVAYIPDNNQANNILPWLLAGNNGGFGGFGGGFNSIVDIFGLAIVAQMLGWNGGGFGGGFGGNGAGMAGFISNQLNNDSGRELLMNAITSQGEASRAAAQNIATAIGQDFNLVFGAIQSMQNGLSSLALQQAVSVPQIINYIQSGNSSLASQLCECCCNMRQLVTSQGYENQLRTVEQTNQLGSQADRNTAAITGAIAALQTNITKEFCDVKEREMQADINRKAEIITQLRGQIDNANQTAAITGYINSLVSPIAKEVDDIKCKLPNTVPVTWPNLAAVNTTPYVSGGYYQGGFGGLYGAGVPGFGGFNF